jgi:hypothetical protein
MKMTERKNVSIDADKHKRLRKFCADTDRNIYEVVEAAITEYLNRRQAKK